MEIAVHYEHGSGELLCEWVTRVDPHHEVGRQVGSPRTRVVEVVFGVQRVVTDQAREDSSLYGQPFPNRREKGNVRGAEVPQPPESREVRRGRRKSEYSGILSGLGRQFK